MTRYTLHTLVTCDRWNDGFTYATCVYHLDSVVTFLNIEKKQILLIIIEQKN